MDNNTGHPAEVLGFTVTSLFGAVLSWTLKDAQVVMAIGASVIAMVSGGFAIRYYYLSIKKLK